MKQKILGTVQLGLPYGINNGVMPERSYSLSLLEAAYDQGIRYLDTASAYGESLDVIGDYHQQNPQKKFHVFSKFMLEEVNENLSSLVEKQCQVLNVKLLEGLYFHRFTDYLICPSLVNDAEKIKHKVKAIGVSIYSLDEYKKANLDKGLDIIQIPMSIFHHHSLLRKELDENQLSKKLYARSIYLQGLLFISHEKLIGKLSPFLEVRKFLENIARELKLSLSELAASYVMDMKMLEGVLFGAETINQIEDSARLLKASSLDWDYLLKRMPIVQDNLLNPGNWK